MSQHDQECVCDDCEKLRWAAITVAAVQEKLARANRAIRWMAVMLACLSLASVAASRSYRSELEIERATSADLRRGWRVELQNVGDTPCFVAPTAEGLARGGALVSAHEWWSGVGDLWVQCGEPIRFSEPVGPTEPHVINTGLKDPWAIETAGGITAYKADIGGCHFEGGIATCPVFAGGIELPDGGLVGGVGQGGQHRPPQEKRAMSPWVVQQCDALGCRDTCGWSETHDGRITTWCER